MRRIKKKLLACLMALVMVVSFPTVAFASDVIDTEAELVDAIAAGGEVVVGGDITITSPITVTGDVTLKAESAVTLTTAVVDVFTVTGELTLDDNITVNSTNSILWAKGDGVINVDGAILNTTAGKNSLGFAQDNGVINVMSGEVNGKSADLTSGGTPAPTLSVSGTNAQINVSGGTVTSTTSSTILVKNGATVTVTGGTVKTDAKNAADAGYVTIFVKEGTRGTIVVKDGTIDSTYGAAVDANEGAVEITGGELTGGTAAVVKTEGTVKISGGTFSSDVSDYVANGCTTVTDEDGNCVVATVIKNEADLRAAINLANEPGDATTLVIGAGFDVTGSLIEVSGDITLVAEEGITLTTSVEDLFAVTGELTLGENITVNSTNSILWAKGDGVINVDGAILNTTAGKNSLGFAQDNGVINVMSGEVNGKSADLTSGGTPAPTLSVSGTNAQINVSGGTVTSTTSSTILVKNGATVTVTGGAVKTDAKNAADAGYVTIFVKEGTTGTIVVEDGTIDSTYGAAVDANAGAVEITGGEFTGGTTAVAATTGTVEISGGTFSSEIPDEFLAEDCGDFEVQDGKFQVHKHTIVDVVEVAATCTEAGTTAGTKCSECDEILSGCEEIEATGHTLTAVAAKEATTEADGNKAYWTCECGKWFADKDAKTEITDKTSVVIPKLEKPEEPTEPVEEVTVSYTTHVQSKGWIDEVTDGKPSGTTGEAKRLESIKISVDGNDDLGISYSAHVQSKGWIDAVVDGEECGTTGEAKRLEAIKIELTGADKDKYNVWYRVHAQSYGWLGWAKNGEAAGTAGQSKRLESIEIVVLPVGEVPEGQIGYAYIELGKSADNEDNSGLVNYMTHVQTYGDQSYVADGSIAGTFGEAKRLEAISIKLNTELLGVEGGIKYRTHVQTHGWLDYVADGKESGTTGEAKRLEAIQIELTGDVAEKYDVYYRVHAQTYGWLGWAKNGEEAGTEGLAKRIEAIQIVLVPKGQDAPSILPGVEGTEAFIKK